MEAPASFTFALNGERVEVLAEAHAASTTLNEFLRAGRCQGTKLSCGQGGCGACTVALSEWTATGPKTRTVASCLLPLVQVAGRSVTTVEGLCKGGGEHPIQTRIGHYFGSQCGFCTPGMVMQLYGVFSSKEGGKTATPTDVEKALEGGNLCRCTGYRPILDAGKSFCGGGVAHHSAGPTVVSEMHAEGLDGPYNAALDPVFPEWLRDEAPAALGVALGGTRLAYLQPAKLADATNFMVQHPTCSMISGHTSAAVHMPLLNIAAPVLDVSRIEELRVLQLPSAGGPGRVKVGAAVTLEDFAEALAVMEADWALVLARHLRLIASPQVRHRATLGGNLALARSCNAEGEIFPSDVAPLLLALDATVEEWREGETSIVSLSDWLAASKRGDISELLVAVHFEAPSGTFESYRVAARARQCKADLSAAFLAQVDDVGRLVAVRVAYGSLGGDCRPRRGMATEQWLQGQKVAQLCKEGLPPGPLAKDLEAALDRDVPAAEPFRRHLAPALLAKFIARLGGGAVAEDRAEMLHGEVKLHSGHQVLPVVEGLAPFGGAGVPKSKVELQCKGEAFFVDDLARRAGDFLHAAIVLCKVPPRSRLLTVRGPEGLEALGASFYGKADVAQNEWDEMGNTDHLFIGVGDIVNYWGEPCGIVVAPTGEAAREAAALVSKHLEASAPEGPALTEVAKVRVMERAGQDIAELVLSDMKGGRGDAAKIFAGERSGLKSVKGNFQKNGQLHWYMEPQVCYVELDEGGQKLTVNSATQCPPAVQEAVAKVLGLDMCRIEVKHRRCGGGFGGKASPSVHYASMAALGALKTGQAVRLLLPREVDSLLVGGRERLDVEYELLLEEQTGLIKAAQVDILAAVGWRGGFGPMMAGSALDGTYMVPHIDVRARSIRTHSAHTQAVRGPGHHEAALIAETMLDHAAHAAGLPIEVIRERNFYSMGNPMNRLGMKFGMMPPLPVSDVDQIPKIFEAAKSHCRLMEREAEVAAFNREHSCRKRGLGVSMTKYGILRFGSHNCLVNIYKDGSIVIHADGSEIGQGLQTKAIQMARRCLSSALPEGLGPIPESLVRVADQSSDVVLTGMTGGSVTSEAVCYSIEDACFQLLEKLSTAKATFEKECAKGSRESPQSAESAWRTMLELTKPASPLNAAPYLSAIGSYAAGLDQLKYDTYTAGIVEVEVDGLTGEYNVRHASVVFESGPLLHGGIEIGQIEGSFIMGLGAMTTEQVAYDETTSRLVSDNTWHYKMPTARDVPGNFEVQLLNLTEESPQRFDIFEWLLGWGGWLMGGGQGAKLPASQRKASQRIKSAKATGEPPLCAASAVVSALRQAITAFGATEFVELNVPVTVEQVSQHCAKAMQARHASESATAADAELPTQSIKCPAAPMESKAEPKQPLLMTQAAGA